MKRLGAPVLAGLTLFASLAPLVAHCDGGQGTQFRGYTEANRLVHERIASLNGFELGKYLGEASSEPSPNGLLQLLGTFLGSDTDAEFRNGEPNSLNMILWYVLVNGLSKDVANYCKPTVPAPVVGQLDLNPAFLAALKPLCAWPAPVAMDEMTMRTYWLALMSFDATEEEFQAWRAYFVADPAYANAPAVQAVAALTLAALYNPYFLLSE